MQIFVGKLIEDKEDKVVVEIGKHDKVKFQVEEGSQFYTLMFVKNTEEQGVMQPWDPFEADTHSN